MMKSTMGAMIALTVAATVAPAQEVGVTANVGWASEYIFRGIPQKTSSASAGLDVTAGPLSVGTWAADVEDGNEVDLYGRLNFASGIFKAAIGGTGYFYTGDFDDTYLEGNVEAGVGPLSAAFALGQHDVEHFGGEGDGENADYWFLGVTAAHAGFSATFGHFDYNDDDDASGNYGQVRYDFALADLLDVGIAWVVSDEDLSGLGRVDHTLVLSLGKKFTLR